jgi:methionine-S-sulfoxide reductase
VVRTRVGYTGGTQASPTYRRIGDHTESVQVDYDPEQITYAELLEVFWQGHNPTTAAYSRQYMDAVFYHNEEQKGLALETRERTAAELGRPLTTEVLPANTFYLAEDYHQKWNLRTDNAFYPEVAEIYPQTEDLIASTAAARINGYLGGYGTREQVQAVIDDLGLSPELRERLLNRFGLRGEDIGTQCPVDLS